MRTTCSRPEPAETDRRADRLRPGVSTSGQILDRQTRALAEAGCLRVFADKLSGKTADRPELAACLDYLPPGDTLVVPSLDRLSRSLADLITLVAGLRRQRGRVQVPARGAGHHHPGRPAGLPRLRRAGRVHPRADRGGHPRGPGRRPRPRRAPGAAPGDDRRADPPGPRPADPPGNSISSIARLLGVSRSTIYKHLPELAAGHNPAAVQIPPSRPGLPARLAITATQAARPDAGSGDNADIGKRLGVTLDR